MKLDPRFVAIRTSPTFRGYLSDLLIELIHRLCPLVLLTATSMKNKTINDVAILRTIEHILIDGHSPSEVITLNNVMLPNPDIVKDHQLKQAEAVKAGTKYEYDINTVPKVPGYTSSRTIKYPSAGYVVLHEKVQQKMAIYDSLSQKEKAIGVVTN